MVTCTTDGAAALAKNEFGTNDIDMEYFAFDGGATEERIQFRKVMPPDWDRGTIKARFHWGSATSSTSGDTVEWGIKAMAIGNSDAIDVAMGSPDTITDTLLASNGADLQKSEAAEITIGGTPQLGDMIVFEVYRNTDGTDDMTEDAWLFGVEIQYQKDKVVAEW
jgi:predicted porin